MSDIQTGRVGPITCPACDSETTFWMQDNGRAMCPCSARRTIEASDLPDGIAVTPES
ncbi:MAG: hypothetical protein JJ899_12725 [Alphaproteobacteria bacterium]|nr:hypothetical protein [Alphaproteobacteria bacterium]